MDAICPHMLPRSQCVHCLRAVVSGIRQGWRHCDDAWPTREQQDAITNAVMTSVDEWFVFEEAQ